MPDEKLSRFESVSLFTTGSVASIGKSTERGKIAVGYDADFTVLDKDLFEVEEEEILAATVQLTVVAGEVVYKL